MFGLLRRGKPVDVADIVARVGRGEMLLIDVREPGEFRDGHAAAAVNVPVSQVGHFLRPGGSDCLVDGTDHPIALYCATGARSWMVSGMLKKMGYRDVVNLGGLSDWRRAGGAFAR